MPPLVFPVQDLPSVGFLSSDIAVRLTGEELLIPLGVSAVKRCFTTILIHPYLPTTYNYASHFFYQYPTPHYSLKPGRFSFVASSLPGNFPLRSGLSTLLALPSTPFSAHDSTWFLQACSLKFLGSEPAPFLVILSCTEISTAGCSSSGFLLNWLCTASALYLWRWVLVSRCSSNQRALQKYESPTCQECTIVLDLHINLSLAENL